MKKPGLSLHYLYYEILYKYDTFPVESIIIEGHKISTHDFTFNDPTTLSNCIHKLRGGFYDDSSAPYEAILPKSFRTSQYMANAAEKLYKYIANQGCSNIARPTKEFLLALSTDQHDTDEYRDKEIVDEPDSLPNQPYPDNEEVQNVNILEWKCDNL